MGFTFWVCENNKVFIHELIMKGKINSLKIETHLCDFFFVLMKPIKEIYISM